MNILKHLKFVATALLLLLTVMSCDEQAEHDTVEEETTNMNEQMKVVQPVVDSAHEAAAQGDSTLLENDKK